MTVARRRGFAAVALLLAFLLQEFFARLLLPLPAVHNFHRSRYKLITRDDSRRGELRQANLIVESEPDGFRLVHRLNLHGFRGPEISLAKGVRRRVLAIGDSFVEGWGADEQETIPAQIHSLRPELDVINLGVSGTGLPEYAALVADAVPLLRPDDVLLVVYANDFPCDRDPSPPNPHRAPAPRRAWLPRVLAVASDWRRGHAVVVRGVRPEVHFLPVVPAPESPFTASPAPARRAPEIVDACRRGTFNPWTWDCRDRANAAMRRDDDPHAAACLQKIAAVCRDHGTRLTIAFIPYAFTASARYLAAYDRMGGAAVDTSAAWDGPERRGAQRFLARQAAALGCPFVDATDMLCAAERAGTPMFWTYDLHCTPAGYAQVAAALAPVLR